MTLVLAGIRDHESKVGVDQGRLGLEVAALDPFGQLDLLGAGQQRVAPDLLEEQRHRVGGACREVVVRVGRRFDVLAPAVVTQVEAPLLQHVVHDLGVLVAKICLLDKLAELR